MMLLSHLASNESSVLVLLEAHNRFFSNMMHSLPCAVQYIAAPKHESLSLDLASCSSSRCNVFCAAEIVPINVKIVEGRTLELNCSLKAYSKPQFNSSNMYFTVILPSSSERKSIDQRYYRIVGPRMLQLLYPDVPVNASGTYECQMNETISSVRLAGVVVSVGS